MTATTERGRQPSGPRRTIRWWVDLGLLVLGIVVFSWLHDQLGTDAGRATGHAEQLIAVERTLHLDVEVGVNRWLVEHPTLARASVLYYRLYYLPVVGSLLWVLLRHPVLWRRVGVALLTMAALALLCFWWLPMSPPRFALPGVVDVVAERDLFGGTSSRDLTNGQNHFSAMPSLHVGWSLIAAYAAASALRPTSRRLALLPWLLPIGMVAVVLGTGNHYVLDVVGSLVLFTLSLGAATAWSRLSAREGRAGRRR